MKIHTDHPFLPYAQQHISKEDREAVSASLTQPIITRGECVKAFEEAVAATCGATYALAFSSGTAALMASFAAVETGPSDKVVTTPNTFVSTVGSAYQRRAEPIFIDIDLETGNLNLEQLSHNINRRQSKGKSIIVPVHFAGIPVDMQALDAQINDPETVVIEDAAHAIGSTYWDGTKVGSCRWSHMTVFSFHPAKTITTGEGGMVTTNDPDLYRRLMLFRNNGIERDPAQLEQCPYPGYYEAATLSGNYHMTEMQAALGLSQLKRLETFKEKRQALINRYRCKLESIEHIRLLSQPKKGQIAWHLCVAQIDFSSLHKEKGLIMQQLYERNIGTQVHYIPVYRHPAFGKKMGDLTEYFPKMERYYREALSLPLYYDLTENEVDRVAAALQDILFT